MVSRIFCIADGAGGASITDGLVRKFPMEGCVYCHSNPCSCGSWRGSIQADLNESGSVLQSSWSLWDWQAYLGRLYGEANKNSGGKWFIASRLIAETVELLQEEDMIYKTDRPACEVEQGYQLELADSLAWTIAAANECGVDLFSATLERFGNGCGYCQHIPCECGRHNFQQIKF